jgi:23S rRNA (pseudouridine1915-N3)-methyltransferase
LTVGRSRCDWADEAVSDWVRRIRRYGGVEEDDVRAEPFHGDVERVRRAEGDRVLARTSGRDRLVCLDERGERLTSEGFAALIDAGRQQGTVIFALGGPYGHHESVRAAAWRTVRLSDLVLNHEVARVVLYEQLYRGLTLLEGVPYHH